MPDIGELVPALVKLTRREYVELIQQVDEHRRDEAERTAKQEQAKAGMSRDDFAIWVARQHFAIDKGIRRIVHLPAGAPPDEVRLLEVNALASLPENGPVTAVDFMPEIEGIPYVLFVADVTPGQFDGIMGGRLALPAGWRLESAIEIAVDDP